MGVAAVVFVVALKLAALSAVPGNMQRAALVLMPLAGRAGLVVGMTVLPYGRPEGGLGAVFADHHRSWGALLLSLACLAAAGWWLCGISRGLACVGASAGVALVLAAQSWRKIRGWTGDTLGASCEIIEIVPALLLSLHSVGAAG